MVISNEIFGLRVRCRHPGLAGGAVHLIALVGLPMGSAAGGRRPLESADPRGPACGGVEWE